MTRPCFLVVDPEHEGSISTRKLVIETAKLNVITAYSSAEAIEALQRFPNVDAAVVNAGIRDMPCEELIRALKSIQPRIQTVVVESPGSPHCPSADHLLRSFDPARLLDCLKTLQPEKVAVIEQHEEELKAQSESGL